MTYYVDGIDCDLAYYTADCLDPMLYLRRIWRERNREYRRLRSRGVPIRAAVLLSKT